MCDAPGAHALARVAHAAVAPLVAAEEGGGGAVESSPATGAGNFVLGGGRVVEALGSEFGVKQVLVVSNSFSALVDAT